MRSAVMWNGRPLSVRATSPLALRTFTMRCRKTSVHGGIRPGGLPSALEAHGWQPPCLIRGLSTRPVYEGALQEFETQFLATVADVPSATDPAQSSAVLRRLVKSNLLSFTDMQDNPEKFFMAHRLLATIGLNGFGIRFTVQFNLFAGSILGLGGAEHLAMLPQIQSKGELGCFLLTETQVQFHIFAWATLRTWLNRSFFFVLPYPLTTMLPTNH